MPPSTETHSETAHAETADTQAALTAFDTFAVSRLTATNRHYRSTMAHQAGRHFAAPEATCPVCSREGQG